MNPTINNNIPFRYSLVLSLFIPFFTTEKGGIFLRFGLPSILFSNNFFSFVGFEGSGFESFGVGKFDSWWLIHSIQFVVSVPAPQKAVMGQYGDTVILII